VKYATVAPKNDWRVVSHSAHHGDGRTGMFLAELDPASWTTDITQAKRMTYTTLMKLSESFPWLTTHLWKVVS
jgi:hypothetical protein